MPSSGSETTFDKLARKRCSTSRVPSVEAPSTTMCSMRGCVCAATDSMVSAMVSRELNETVMTLMVGVVCINEGISQAADVRRNGNSLCSRHGLLQTIAKVLFPLVGGGANHL